MTRPSYLLFDSCVILDFLHVDPELFSLVSQRLGQVCVARPLLTELESELDVDDVETLGLTIVEAEEADLFEVANRPKSHSNPADDVWGPLSDYDVLCLLTARRFGHVCVTNDRNLRKACEAAGVAIKWGLQIVLDLLKEGAISRERARAIGEEVCKANRWIKPDVLKSFLDKLESFNKES